MEGSPNPCFFTTLPGLSFNVASSIPKYPHVMTDYFLITENEMVKKLGELLKLLLLLK
jgi:hypothetical protein